MKCLLMREVVLSPNYSHDIKLNIFIIPKFYTGHSKKQQDLITQSYKSGMIQG